ncbi:O-methyltransferase [Penicillium sp. IBT 16267x]|nr:O-methyltransferase [Penicillium sp. IBT 16267x]
MASKNPSEILDRIGVVRIAFDNGEAGLREALIDYSQALIASLEIPSEFIQLSTKYRFCYDASRPSFNGFPEYFKKNGYKPPATSGTDGPFQSAHQTASPFFDWLVASPPYLDYFSSFMSAYRAGKPDWFDFYHVENRMVEGFDPSIGDTLLVDVGGGRGHDLATFATRYPSHPGKIILQDREPIIASVVDSNGSESPFEAQALDFFTPQPIKHARAYSLHSILHDWGDDESVKIIENLIPALKRGYSRVLFNEIVVSEENPTLAASNMDMMMLAHLNVSERTEDQWRKLLAKGGLKIIKVHTCPGVAESLIEAELV